MYMGDYQLGETVYIDLNSALGTGASASFSGDLETADFRIYKNNGTTQRSSMAGVTVTNSPFDTDVTGYTVISIDLSDNTDAGFYSMRGEYALVLRPDSETLDSLNVYGRVVRWSIGRKHAMQSVAGVAQAGAAGTITLPSTAVATDDYYNGQMVRIVYGTGLGQSAMIDDYVGSTKVASVSPNWITTPDNTSVVEVIGTPRASTGAPPAVNSTQLAGQTVTAAAGVTFPTSVASPTNITAGTITTVTNLTNAPTSGDLTSTMKASVNAEIVDVLRTDTVSELASVPAANATLSDKINWLFMKARNKITQTATTQLVMADDGTTTVGTSTVSDDGTTATRGEFS